MSSTQKLGSYLPFMRGPRVFYTYEKHPELGWLVYEKMAGMEKTIGIPSKIIRELLIQIDDRDVRLLHMDAILDGLWNG